MPEPSRMQYQQIQYQQIQYEIKLALFYKNLIEEKHLKHGYLCAYGEDNLYKIQEINLDANNNTISLNYDDTEILGGISIWTMDYYIRMDHHRLIGNYHFISFVFDNKQYALTIDE